LASGSAVKGTNGDETRSPGREASGVPKSPGASIFMSVPLSPGQHLYYDHCDIVGSAMLERGANQRINRRGTAEAMGRSRSAAI
jgi:hypothetical protein